MDYEGAKEKFVWNLTHPEPEASEVYTDDAVLEFPQSGERFRGKENFSPWRGAYPVETSFELRSIRGEGDTWIIEGRAGYAGTESMPFINVLHFRGDLIDRETIYLGGAFPPAEDRVPYAEKTPAEPTPGLPITIGG
ncbi:MAG: nuclear transport factor 2 family protein [Propionibacteriaceae bacterium]